MPRPLLQEDEQPRQRGPTGRASRGSGTSPGFLCFRVCVTPSSPAPEPPLPRPPAAAGDGIISIISLCFLQPQVGKAGSSQEGQTFPWFYIESALDDAQPSGGDTDPWCHFRGRRVLSGVPQRPCHTPGGDRSALGAMEPSAAGSPSSALPAPPVTPPGTSAGRLRCVQSQNSSRSSPTLT